MSKLISPAKRARILEALQKPNAKLAKVARQFGVSPSAVKTIRQAAGLNPLPSVEAKDRAAVARDYAMVENRRKRVELASRSLDVAKEFLDQLSQPAKVYSFGRNADGVYAYTEHVIPRPDLKMAQAAMISYGIAIDKGTQLEKYDLESASGAKAALIELVDRLKASE